MFKKNSFMMVFFLCLLLSYSVYGKSSDEHIFTGYLDATETYKIHSIILASDGAISLNIAFDSTLSLNSLQILDTNGTGVATQYNPASGVNYGPFGLKAGTYNIKITRSSYIGGSGGYTLTTHYDAQPLGNDTEPNDQVSDAQNAPNNGSVTGHLGYIGGGNGTQDTIDIYKVILSGDGAISLNIAFDSTLSLNSLQILDTNGTGVATQYNPASGVNYGPYGLKAGTYNIKIIWSSYPGGYGGYTLTTKYDSQPLGNDTEPNDQVSDAQNAPSNGSVTGHLGYIGGGNGTQDTIDIYKVILSGDGAISLNIAFDSALSLNSLQILDTNGTGVATQYNPASGVNYGPYGLKAGTYNIKIIWSSYPGGYGGYTLTTKYDAQPLGNDTEPNDQVSDAQNAPNNGSVTGHLGYIGGGNGTQDTIDIYKVILSGDGAISLNILFDSTLSLNSLQILDTNGTGVATQYNPASGVNYGPYGLKAGTYNIKIIWSSSTGGYGGYTLTTILAGVPTIGLSKKSFNFGSERYGTPTPPEAVIITNSGTGILSWTATPSVNWISVLPGSGTGSGVIAISISRTDMSPGYYTGTIAITDPKASNSPQTINVGLDVIPVGTDSPPFGNYATPDDGATVASSIPVTGWVLDDVGVQSVKIYRGTGLSDRVYIGDAVFSRGSRPDVEVAYPGYPQNDRAGWGYMLLTNFLPNGGNGLFSLLAYATDTAGHEVLLGSKAIICDNLNAIKPFGAIDTPTQGGTASGSAYVNFGWALTPQPKNIPVNGSTITVWIDGLPLGHPVYNNPRADIAALFPGYANTNGAVGYYYLNTTGFENRVHTIAWSVADSAGAADGIGSRYFTIQNVAPGSGVTESLMKNVEGVETKASPDSPISYQNSGIRPASEIAAIPDDRQTPVYVKRGFMDDQLPDTVFPETDGAIRFEISEVSRVAIYLDAKETRESEESREVRNRRILSGSADSGGASRYEAYQLVQGELRPLPIGATFDTERGVLYWQPGPGFLGEYRFLIVDISAKSRKTIEICIIPK